jgi:hypothetical protein
MIALLLIVAAPRASAAAPACSTFDGANRPARNFDAGDEIIVRGTGFAPNSLVLVNVQQATLTSEVAHLRSNDLGAFSTDPSTSRLPRSVQVGTATIQVFQGSGAASCDIRIVSAAASKTHGFGRTFYFTWGAILALCAIGLIVATFRRRQAERLSDEMDQISWRRREGDGDGGFSPPGAVGPRPLLAPLEHDTGADDYLGDEEEYDGEEEDGADDRPIVAELAYPPSRPAGDATLDGEPIEDEREPSHGGHTSDAVARLQREVRAWRSR